MTLSDMRWLWVYFRGSPGGPLDLQIPALFPKGSKARFEGSGTSLVGDSSGLRDVAYIFPSVALAFQAARALVFSDLPLERVRIAAYAAKTDPDHQRLRVSIEVKRSMAHVTPKPDPLVVS